ncbi:chemotaxis protein CheB [Cryptosporangium phraense]|uniref:protein-glutamate methylesterase n=1 Tax=Cryptosporangium phraense TaxID=2593070 RepID=A0A545ALP9_9ACTN|nr:chemotaxis protein CheB [Cryptosporangium phraense]TQS42190.1 chemotaxis protein CheB [Cryptosporangium phraense]
MRGRPLVVVGASAGGVESLRAVVRGFPPDLAAAVLVVLHTSPGGTSVLASILDRSGPLPATTATDGEHLRPGHIYVAPPDHHLTVTDGHCLLSRGPRENGNRPAIDPLFRSAVRAHGSAVVGVVLSGMLDDGAAGLATITRHSGAAVVQDPEDALYAGMPRAALAVCGHATVAPADKLGPIIALLVGDEPIPDPHTVDPLLEHETAIAELNMDELNDSARPGVPAGLGCPDCSGALFAVTEGPMTRYRCRVGHAWSPDSLLDRQNIAVEGALWMALRTMEDKAALHRRLADSAFERGAPMTANANIQAADELGESARLIRDLLAQEPPGQP